jgi:hypothetical protein
MSPDPSKPPRDVEVEVDVVVMVDAVVASVSTG